MDRNGEAPESSARQRTPEEEERAIRQALYDAARRAWYDRGEIPPPGVLDRPPGAGPSDYAPAKPHDPGMEEEEAAEQAAARRAWYDRGELPRWGVLPPPRLPSASPKPSGPGALEELSGFLTVGFWGLVFLAVVGVVLLVVAAVVLWAYRTVF